MKSNIAEFNATIDKFTASVPEKVSILHRKVVMQALTGVVLKTPVDTGRARGNWQVSIGQPINEVFEGTDKIGNATIERGFSIASNIAPYEIVYISNNIYYIIYLENGSSDQAPAGMVALTIEELKTMFT